ncbi:hypothetical protein [Cupriavidus campinensis]|uniref:hypothetical protein n=1 Tax=Cupriavidus campinensis TaxID=151783 RepID=UPI0024E230C7|nr:hypothetical protein [Cupriavidus campinensis]
MKFKAQLFVVNSTPWTFDGKSGVKHVAQMLITSAHEDDDGKVVEETFVARLKVPESLKDTPPGEYITDLRPFADANGNLDFKVVKLVPFARPAATGKAGAGAAAAA